MKKEQLSMIAMVLKHKYFSNFYGFPSSLDIFCGWFDCDCTYLFQHLTKETQRGFLCGAL
jgi:hypothetical protein